MKKSITNFLSSNQLVIMISILFSAWAFSVIVIIEKPFHKHVVCNYQGTIDTIKVPCKVAEALQPGDSLVQETEWSKEDLQYNIVRHTDWQYPADYGFAAKGHRDNGVETRWETYRTATVVQVLE